MSKTIVDMPKVTQMLDAGWRIVLYKGPMGSYEVRARHRLPSKKREALRRIEDQINAIPDGLPHNDSHHLDDDGSLMTDDFTPQQALTRMAYKAVDGRIL